MNRLSKDDLIYHISVQLIRALGDAKKRLDQEDYDIGEGLFLSVEIKARKRNGEKIGRHVKVGDAVNLLTWKDEPDD